MIGRDLSDFSAAELRAIVQEMRSAFMDLDTLLNMQLALIEVLENRVESKKDGGVDLSELTQVVKKIQETLAETNKVVLTVHGYKEVASYDNR